MGGTPFERGALYTILKNQTYLGLTTHKGQTFDGEHDPIIPQDLFDKVQSILTSNRKRDKHKTGAKNPSLLAGKIITDTGLTLTPTHAQTGGRRYRYYVERRRGDNINHQVRPVRLPAAEIENSVRNELAGYMADPIKLMDDLGLNSTAQETHSAIQKKTLELVENLRLQPINPQDQIIIRRLVQSVRLQSDIKGYELTIDLAELIKILHLNILSKMEATIIKVRIKLTVCNNGKKVIIGNKAEVVSRPNPALINALKLAHVIKEQYLGHASRSLTDIAVAMNMNKRQIWRTLKMAFLAPKIQLAILSGTQPRSLCVQDILDTPLAFDWKQQSSALGFK